VTYFFLSGIDRTVEAVISIVSGSIGFYIVLACFGIIKEFQFKAAGIEFTSKLDEVKGEVNKSREEVKEKIMEMTQNIMNNQQILAASSKASATINFLQEAANKAEAAEQKKDKMIAEELPKREGDEKPSKRIPEDKVRRFEEEDKKVKLLSAILPEPIRRDPAKIKKDADFYFFGRRWKEAEELYGELIELNPYAYDAMIKRSRALINLHRFEEAEKWYEKAFRESGVKDPIKLSLIATAYARVKKKEEAERLIEEALKLSYNSNAVLYNAACVYSLLGSEEEALNKLKELMKKDTGYFKNMAKTDEDLSNIRKRKEFEDLLQ
jgi:tetratricopeptide (TPR) repeat protein